jgi:hypothetical protein
MQQLAPVTWQQALAGVLGASPARQDDIPGSSAVEIAIYPDVIWLAARGLREHGTSPAPRDAPARGPTRKWLRFNGRPASAVIKTLPLKLSHPRSKGDP